MYLTKPQNCKTFLWGVLRNENECTTRKSTQTNYNVKRSILFFASQCQFSSSLKERVGTLGHKLGLKVRLDDTMWQGKLDLGIL